MPDAITLNDILRFSKRSMKVSAWITKLTKQSIKRFKRPDPNLCGREAIALMADVPGCIPVYVIYSKFNQFRFKHFFKPKQSSLDRELADHPLFLDLNTAVDYCRFLPAHHGIVKLYVPQHAVIGCDSNLRLKDNCITSGHIHGFMPGRDSDFYVKNPYFSAQAQISLT